MSGDKIISHDKLTLSVQLSGEMLFGIALVILILSLAISIREIPLSVRAPDPHLSNMEL